MPFTIHLSILIFLPLATGLIAAFLPAKAGRWLVVAGALGVLGYVIAMLIDFDPEGGQLRYVTDANWISELGIRWQLGIDGLNLFLIALTAILWVPATLWAALRTDERPRLFMFHMALAETAVLGAFCAQDLAVFVVFFDLMLVPFYFLIGGWGSGDRVAATTKFVIYTLVGSLLMLAGAIALGVLATPDGGELSYSLAVLEERTLSPGSQEWIFVLFAVAFLVKAPLFPVPRLGGRHLPRHADAGARAAVGRALEGGRLRLPAHRAADPSRRRAAVPEPDAHPRGVLDPLRVDPRLLPGRGAPGGGLLLDRPARLHRARHLLARRQGRAGRADADGQPRTRGGAAVLHHRRAERAGRGLALARPHGRDGDARARARGAVPRRGPGHARDARQPELRRRDPDPLRRLRGQARVRPGGQHRRRAGRGVHDPHLPEGDAQPRRARRQAQRSSTRWSWGPSSP